MDDSKIIDTFETYHHLTACVGSWNMDDTDGDPWEDCYCDLIGWKGFIANRGNYICSEPFKIPHGKPYAPFPCRHGGAANTFVPQFVVSIVLP